MPIGGPFCVPIDTRQLIRIWVGKFEVGALTMSKRLTRSRNTKPRSLLLEKWWGGKRWRSNC